MKRVLQYVFIGLFLLFAWPFFLYRKYGNKSYQIQGSTIIVANHYSTFDPLYIWMIYKKYKIRFVTTSDVKKRKFAYFITWLFDCLYVDYKASNFGFFKACLKILKEGGVLCIFPEGAVNPRKAGFFDFKPSFLFFARRTKATILPLYLYPENALFKRSSVYIGDPVPVEEYGAYEDDVEAITLIQSRIMDYSFKVPQARNVTLELFDSLKPKK